MAPRIYIIGGHSVAVQAEQTSRNLECQACGRCTECTYIMFDVLRRNFIGADDKKKKNVLWVLYVIVGIIYIWWMKLMKADLIRIRFCWTVHVCTLCLYLVYQTKLIPSLFTITS